MEFVTFLSMKCMEVTFINSVPTSQKTLYLYHEARSVGTVYGKSYCLFGAGPA
jgi:hypothetical protein